MQSVPLIDHKNVLLPFLYKINIKMYKKFNYFFNFL